MEDKTKSSNSIGYIDDKYLLLLDLSFGGEGFVYKVEEKFSHKIFAAKIAKESEHSFKNEIGILKSLKENGCKNIINYINSGNDIIKKEGEEEEKKNYLILELAPHHDLSEYIRYKRQGFEEHHSKVIFFKMVKCIQSIHELGICHRDIKLDNFVLDEKFNPKIGDFGHAIKYKADLSGKCGTKEYEAPEVGPSKKYDGYKVDIFSLGICLIELISGVYGFYMKERGNKYYEYIIDGKKEEFWNLIKNNRDINFSDDLKNLSFDLVSQDPKKRAEIGEIFKHSWFGNIPKMNPIELEQYEKDINLRQEFEIRFEICKIESIREFQRAYEKYLFEKMYLKSDDGEDNNGICKNGTEPEFIKFIYFDKFYINIKGLSDPINFINSLYNKILIKFGKNYCYIDTPSKKGIKLNITFYGNKKENSEENESTMQIILYKTSEGYVLRFLREKISKNDFFKKFGIISDLVKKLI